MPKVKVNDAPKSFSLAPAVVSSLQPNSVQLVISALSAAVAAVIVTLVGVALAFEL